MIKKIKILTIFLLILIIFFLHNILIFKENTFLKVVFLDVGQGDSIFIETPSGKQTLIDAGMNSAVVRQISKHLPFFDKKINLLISTHSDMDHVGGFPEIINRYKIDFFAKNFIEDKDALNTEISNLLSLNNIEQKNFQIGDKIILDKEKNIELFILWPPKDSSFKNNNDSSLVALLSFGNINFIFTGDASIEIENKIINYLKSDDGNLIYSKITKQGNVNILKAGHHGSKTSTSEEFLIFLKPNYVIISSGKDNKFGHPDLETIERIQKNTNAVILNTAFVGSIYFQSDGEKVWLIN